MGRKDQDAIGEAKGLSAEPKGEKKLLSYELF